MTFKDPAEIRQFGTQIGPQTGRSQAQNARGGARKTAQTDSERFQTSFGAFPSGSKTLQTVRQLNRWETLQKDQETRF